MNSKKLLIDMRQLNLVNWQTQLQATDLTADFTAFENHLSSGDLPHSVIVDLTSSEDIARRYEGWLARGFNIITANKKANTLTQDYYDQLRLTAQKKRRHFIYSTNVGAGLPIIQTLRDLHHTGDTVLNIEGVLSGTLSYLFNGLTPAQNFSNVVGQARNQGYTEPDPRDDLSGTDVARKLVILAREIGLKLELADVDVENLVPEPLRAGSVDHFIENLPQFDEVMKGRLENAHRQNQVLRYVATLSAAGRAKIELKAYPLHHPFARVRGTDNIVAFTTERYEKQPLIIQGPGAGPQVTAAGVFADLLRLTSYLGAAP